MARTVLLLAAIVTLVAAQTYTVSPIPTKSCTYSGGNCNSWTFDAGTNTWDSGNNLGFHSLNNVMQFTTFVQDYRYFSAQFEYQVVSQEGADIFYVDGDSQRINGQGFSGNISTWTPYATTKYSWSPQGDHSIQFRYTKNNAIEVTPDRVLIRNLKFYLYVLRCNGVGTSTSGVCSGRGACTPYNTTSEVGQCICSANNYGSNCEVPLTCNGVAYTNTTYLCSQAGTCNGNYNNNGTGVCDCNLYKYGSNCEQTLNCGGVDYNKPNVCSAHGTCTAVAAGNATGVCSCSTYYGGSQCDIPITCNGIPFTDPASCGSHGYCYSNPQSYITGTGVCSCAAGYYGNMCQVPVTCSGISYSDPSACSGNGVCSGTQYQNGTGTCLCNYNRFGSNCEQKLQCAGVAFDSTTVCSSRGNCSNVGSVNGNCTCQAGYTGVDCSVSSSIMCNGTLSSDISVCNAKGTCSQDPTATLGVGKCTCNENYSGSDCRTFSLTCNGVAASNPNACSGQGTCKADSSGKGSCTCKSNYFGSNCENAAKCNQVPFYDTKVCNIQKGTARCEYNTDKKTATCVCNKEGAEFPECGAGTAVLSFTLVLLLFFVY